jgi:hypothetical protein
MKKTSIGTIIIFIGVAVALFGLPKLFADDKKGFRYVIPGLVAMIAGYFLVMQDKPSSKKESSYAGGEFGGGAPRNI